MAEKKTVLINYHLQGQTEFYLIANKKQISERKNCLQFWQSLMLRKRWFHFNRANHFVTSIFRGWMHAQPGTGIMTAHFHTTCIPFNPGRAATGQPFLRCIWKVGLLTSFHLPSTSWAERRWSWTQGTLIPPLLGLICGNVWSGTDPTNWSVSDQCMTRIWPDWD